MRFERDIHIRGLHYLLTIQSQDAHSHSFACDHPGFLEGFMTLLYESILSFFGDPDAPTPDPRTPDDPA